MSRTSRILTSTILGYVQMAVTTLINLWWTPFLLRHFTQHDYGLWMAGLPALTYVSLVDFGVIAVLQRDVAFALGNAGGDFRNASDLPLLVGRTQRLVLMQMPAVCIAAFVAWLAIATRNDWQALRTPFAIVLVALVVSFPLRVNHAVLMGLQDLAFVTRLGMITWVACIGGAAVLVLLGWKLRGLAVAWAATQIATNLGHYARVRLRFSFALPRGLPALPRSEAGARLRKGFWITLSQLAAILLNGSDVIVIAAVLGPASVVPYSITGKLIGLLANAPQSIMVSAQPALSELRSSAERGRLADICSALAQAVLLMSGLIAALVIAVDRGFVTWWVGSAQFAGGTLVLFLVIAMVANHWWTTTTYTIFSFGYERRISLTMIAYGVVTAGATVVLTRRFGIVGAPMATLVALALIGLPSNLRAIADETRRPALASVKPLLPWAWRSALLSAGLFLAARLWLPNSVLKLVVTSLIVVTVYALIMFPLAFREPLATYARPRFAALRLRFVGARAES
jgi:O-antigen/teichoic acid export membrane protein